MAGFAFDTDTTVEQTGEGRFEGYLDERWTIGPVPNGGYAMALGINAARSVVGHHDPLTTNAHFLSPASAGTVELSADIVKPGRSTSTVMISLFQSGRERIRMLTTLGDLAAREGPSQTFLRPPDLEGPFEEQRSSFMQRFPENFDFRIPAAVSGGIRGEPTARPEMGGTIAFGDGRPPDLLSLPVMADGFPPVAFNLGHLAWTPTIELTVHFWNHPAPGPVTVWLVTEALEGGYHDESGNLWDSEGTLVARSRQLALIL